MRRFSRSLVAMMAVTILVGVSARSEAALILTLSEGADSVTVQDNGAGDANAVVGAITFIGDVGVFDVNVSTGLSKPVLPSSQDLAHMDLSSVNVSSAAGTLLIELTDTDFLATGPGTLTGSVGGTAQGELGFIGAKCANNSQTAELCDPAAAVFLGPFDEGAFSGSASELHGALGPYSMTMLAFVTHGSGVNSSSFDFELKNVPEPTSIALLGLGLLGCGAASRRRKMAR